MNDNTYSTEDLGLAAYLKLSGIEFQGILPSTTSRNRGIFIFKNSTAIGPLVKSYFDNSARVNPLILLIEMRTLKTYVATMCNSTGGIE